MSTESPQTRAFFVLQMAADVDNDGRLRTPADTKYGTNTE
jgi:hypothetical protein